MTKQITNLNDVLTFAKQIISEGVSFNPNDDFKDYVVIKTNNITQKQKQKAEMI